MDEKWDEKLIHKESLNMQVPPEYIFQIFL